VKIDPCTHRPTCPGCPRYGEPGLADAPRLLLERFAGRTGAVLDEVIEGAALAFRVRARLAVRGRASSPKLGIFQEGTHAIADIPSCRIQHPRINEAAKAIRAAIRHSKVAPYADKPHTGLLRYVEIVVERATGRVQVTLVANDDDEETLLPMAAELEQLLGDRLHGLWWNGNRSHGNAIFGSAWKRLAGAEAIEETIGGAKVFFPPGAFGQNNLDLADRLVEDLHSRVLHNVVVTEFHCGVGSIGLGLVARSRELRLNELSPRGLLGLAMGLDALPDDQRAKTTVVDGTAAEAIGLLRGADVVIVDPPRKGLERDLIEALKDYPPPLLLYVSCDAASLVRDAEAIVATSELRLRRLTPYAMFPYSEHVETLAEFRL
jgi:23S rRNA (uracil1939-C5)-methyltransferase